MAKQKLWLKKRTTRGNRRVVTGKPKRSAKNATRELYKNQHWYSHFFLKFVICALLGFIWLQTGFVVELFGHTVSIFPIGFVVGLFILVFERVARYRLIEFLLLFIAMTLSFFWPIGFVIH
jgi:hypothetical protein